MTDSAEGVVIADGGTGQKLILLGVTVAELAPTNFVFTFTEVREDHLDTQLGFTAPDSQIIDFDVAIAGGGTVTGGTAGDLDFGDLATFNLRVFMDLGQKPKLIEKMPFLKGSRLRLAVDNIFDAQRKITDGNGIVPLNYQPGYIDPLGRYIELEWRKTF
eukprot:gene20217-24784_t